MSDALIEIRITEGIAHLRFNRPRQLNAFNNELMRETLDAMSGFEANDDVRVIIVSGNGRAFSAGFDLKAAAERQLSGHDAWRRQLELQFDFIMCLWDARVPTIAAVHGYCLAGALELSLAADITIAANDCLFGEPEVRFGSGAVAMLFPWITGPKAAKELLFTGEERMPAERAYQLGLVNRLVAADQLMPEAGRMARTIAKASPSSVQKTKRALSRAYDIMGLRSALAAGLDIDVDINATPSFEKQEFARIRKEQGVKAAIAWRGARFAD